MVKRAAFTKMVTEKYIYQDHLWNVRFGELRRRKGNPGLAERLFRIVGEKLPYEALSAPICAAYLRHLEAAVKEAQDKEHGA